MIERLALQFERTVLASPENCLVCGSKVREPVILPANVLRRAYEAYFKVTCPEDAIPNDFLLSECPECGLEFVIDPEVPTKFYPWVVELPEYYPAHRSEWDLLMAEFVGARRKIAVLEVGCGSGIFLAKLSKLPNVEAVGVDLTQSAIEACQKQGLKAVAVDLQGYLSGRCEGLPRQFDYIFGCHLLEHVPDPLSLLRDCFRLLAPHGSVMMSLPLSPNDHEGQMLDPLLYPPNHLSRWTVKSFQVLGERLNAHVNLSPINARAAHKALSHAMFCSLKFRGSEVSLAARLKLLIQEPLRWGREALWQFERRSGGRIVSDHILLKLTPK